MDNNESFASREPAGDGVTGPVPQETTSKPAPPSFEPPAASNYPASAWRPPDSRWRTPTSPGGRGSTPPQPPLSPTPFGSGSSTPPNPRSFLAAGLDPATAIDPPGRGTEAGSEPTGNGSPATPAEGAAVPFQWYHSASAPVRDTTPSQRRGTKAVSAAIIAVVVLVAASLGGVVGHFAFSSAPTAAPAVASTPSATAPSSGSGPGYSPFGNGFDPYAGSGPTGSSTTTSPGPSDAAALARGVEAGLVDINTTLSYEGEAAAGTGMVLTSNGEVLTNNHVIEGATSISVTDIGNGKTYSANIVGYDHTQDVAVLQLVNASGLQTVSLGNSKTVKVGAEVVGVGNAGGIGGTPSFAGGTVIDLDRSITASDAGNGTTESLKNMIESNADIQPGDSGGPLLNTAGKVVGMDTAGSSSSAFPAAISTTTEAFSIPIDEALHIAGEIEHGDSSSLIHIGPTAFLGIEVDPGAPTIVAIIPKSGAAGAGLVPGDTITALAGHSVVSSKSLTNIMTSLSPGQSVRLTYTTPTGSSATVNVLLGSGPPQ
jgi:S1-C subfamily serine protease